MIENLMKLIEMQQISDEQSAYNAGVDCGKNGPNTSNCHFGYFSRPSMTNSWQRGKQDGEKLTALPHLQPSSDISVGGTQE